MRIMLSRARVVLAGAAVVTAAGALAVLLAGPTVARAPSPGDVQVSGTTLKSALLPGSAFGPGYSSLWEQDSGRVVKPSADVSAGTMSCSLYSVLLGDASLPFDPGFGFGSTARASQQVLSGSAVRTYTQAVYQFKNPRAAAALFARTYAKYGGCRSFSLKGEAFKLVSESSTRISGHQAFLVEQLVAVPDNSSLHAQTLLSIDGPDVFILSVQAGSGGTPASATPAALMPRLMARVSKLR